MDESYHEDSDGQESSDDDADLDDSGFTTTSHDRQVPSCSYLCPYPPRASCTSLRTSAHTPLVRLFLRQVLERVRSAAPDDEELETGTRRYVLS